MTQLLNFFIQAAMAPSKNVDHAMHANYNAAKYGISKKMGSFVKKLKNI